MQGTAPGRAPTVTHPTRDGADRPGRCQDQRKVKAAPREEGRHSKPRPGLGADLQAPPYQEGHSCLTVRQPPPATQPRQAGPARPTRRR